ncbi:MAG: ABC transporter permease [Aigarchaeota archaeon]|nr:ABC transporter permease [Candidatus Pelearchaeum maunauluense]
MSTRPPKIMNYILLLPGLLVIAFFLVIPLLLTVVISFMQEFSFTNPIFTVENYIEFFTSPQTPTILANTFGMSLLASLVALLVGYPAAYFMTFRIKSIKTRNLIISLLLVPFLIDWNVRTIAWIPILGESGIVNYLLQYFNIVHQPVSLLFSRWTLIIIWLQSNLLFMIFPIYLALSRIDPDLINAARVLKSPPHRVFYEIIFKLSLPGVIVGLTFVFVNTLGDYITPSLWAGGIQVLGLSVANFAANFVWPYAATQSTVLILISLAVLVILFKIVDIKKLVE